MAELDLHFHLHGDNVVECERTVALIEAGMRPLGLEQAEKMGGSEKNHSKCLEISVLWVLERSVEHLSRRHFE